MLRVVIALGAVVAFAGCTSSNIRAQEGHACSTDPSEDPQYTCTPAQDLVCITTYSQPVTNEELAKKFDGGVRQVFVCRLACNASAECPQSGDICCPGQIYGKTYNKIGGCVPPGSCQTSEPEGEDGGTTPPPDTGAKDTGAKDTAPPDAGAADTGPADAVVAPVDAPAGE
jgi:hypothetical protein